MVHALGHMPQATWQIHQMPKQHTVRGEGRAMNRGTAKHGKRDNATHTKSRQVPREKMRWTLIREGRNRGCTVSGGKRERERRRGMRRRLRDFRNQKALLAASPMSLHLLEQNAHQNHIFRSRKNWNVLPCGCDGLIKETQEC